MTPLRELFASDITRAIPPVVYFQEQSPRKLKDEVGEYIITGGWPAGHPNHRRVPDGIHEQYVRLLTTISRELERPGGPDLPNVWISGFYGSGKSSFAKLLGLALDGVAIDGGGSLAEALLQRDRSEKRQELRDAWAALRRKVEPVAVVFDVGSNARDGEHVHSAVVRQVQRRLGYCHVDLVADYELKLERDGLWARFGKAAETALGRPWAAVKDDAMAEDHFSHALHVFDPERYPDPNSWFAARAGTNVRMESPEEAVAALRDMLRHRASGATLFLVVDEVSQYVLTSKDRVDRLRAFATALGSTLKGKAWLLALGQQKLDENADESFLLWARDRFPEQLRVHLAATNIRDVVHRRLLQKKAEAEPRLRALFDAHRQDLKLYAYGCEGVTADEFVETYPLLPGHIDLVLQLTSALRTRSSRAQGDSQAIRGLLQLLGALFAGQGLADAEVGTLVTIEHVYEVQHTALESDVQASMARVLSQCADDPTGQLIRVAKAVALLELIQEIVPTTPAMVSACLYDRLDRGDQRPQIAAALDELRRRNLLGWSEKQGYKIQSTAGEEWESERRDVQPTRDTQVEIVQEALKLLMGAVELPRLEGRGFPWLARFSDGRRADDVVLVDKRDDAPITVDFRFVTKDERAEATWLRRSLDPSLENRLVWVCGDTDEVDRLVRELGRSRAMVARYQPRTESLNATKRLLLQGERNNVEDLTAKVKLAVAAAWMAGRIYFKNRPHMPTDAGAGFPTALHTLGGRVLGEIYRHFVATVVTPAELMLLMDAELAGPPSKFLTGDLGILDLDQGRYVPACSGVVPRRILEHIEKEGGLSGVSLLAWFCGPPYGYHPAVVKACVAGLLRAGRVKIHPDGGAEITAVRDADARELFDKDRTFRRASFFPAGEDDIGFPARARIAKVFEECLGHRMDREDHAIADAVAQLFPTQAQRLRAVLTTLGKLPGARAPRAELTALETALESCVRTCRQTRPTVVLVKRHLDTLRAGFNLLHAYEVELTAEAVKAVRTAADVNDHQVAQLRAVGALDADGEAAATHVAGQLGLEQPWRDIAAIEPDLKHLRDAYAATRRARLAWQEQLVEEARARVKARARFSTLTADQASSVLRPLTRAATDTTETAIAPPLSALEDGFLTTLHRAEADSNERLDEIGIIHKVDPQLHNRELSTEREVDALLTELRTRLMEHIRAGHRIRLS